MIQAVSCLSLLRVKSLSYIEFPTYGSSTSYPIDDTPLVDYDVNRNIVVLNASSAYWWPRSFNLSNYNLNNPWPPEISRWAVNITDFGIIINNGIPTGGISSRTLDTTRGLYRFVIGSSRKLYFPIDIRKSVRPVVTVEYFASIGSASTNGPKMIWSTDFSTTSSTSGTVHAPTLLSYDPNGCGLFFQPYAPTSISSCKLPVGSGFSHIVSVWDQTNNNVTLYVNGHFYQSFIMATVDGLQGININGKIGTSLYDITAQTVVYFRVWGRKLTQQEILAVNADWYDLFTKPIVNVTSL